MKRCQSVEGRLEFYQQYHDYEWGRPQQKEQKLFEILGLEMFQAGLSFEIILKKRANFCYAFKNFDIQAVANYTQAQVNELLHDAGIVRHRGK